MNTVRRCLLATLVVLSAWMWDGDIKPNPFQIQSALAAEPENEAQRQDPTRDKARVDKVTSVAQSIQDMVRESIVFDRIAANDNASVICVIYKPTSGLWSANRQKIAIINDQATNDQKIWDRNCGKATYDMTYIADSLKPGTP